MYEVVVVALRWAYNSFRAPTRPGSPICVLERPGKTKRIGTLGCVVRWRRARFIVTAAHVVEPRVDNRLRVAKLMAKRDRRPPRKGWLPGRAIGTIQPTKKELDSIDCVLAEVERGARVKSRFPTPIGRLDATPVAEKEIRVESTRPDDGLKVQIYGAVSRHSTGYARLGLSISIRSRRGKVRIDPPLIEISPAYETSLDFCRKGDSGALVVTSGGANGPRPLGILVARARGAKMAAMGYAVPIERVIDAIGDGATIHRG